MRPRVQWTAEADAYLRANYMTTSNAKLAKHFGISQPTLQRHLREISLDGNKVGKTRWTIGLVFDTITGYFVFQLLNGFF